MILVIPTKIDWLKWLHQYDTGSGQSRIYALKKAFEDMRFTKSHDVID